MEVCGNYVTPGSVLPRFAESLHLNKDNIIDNNRIGRRSSWTPEADTAGVQGFIPDGCTV